MTQGANTKFGIGTTDPVTDAFEANVFNIVSTKPHLNANGQRGTRSQIAERTIEGVEECGGPITLSPNITEAALILPWVGFLNTAGVFSLTEALTSRYVTADKVTKVEKNSGVYVGKCTIRAAKGVVWDWTLDTVGQQQVDDNAGTFPNLSLTEAPPLALHHAVLTLLGSPRSFSEVTITIDNVLDVQANNAPYNELIEPSDRIVTVDLMMPYTTANADLKKQGIDGDDAATIVFTYGDYVATFTFGNLKFPNGAVEVPGKTGLMLRLSGQAYMTGATRELVIEL